jgi:reverse gyrase
MADESLRELLSKLLKRRDELRLESEALDKLIETYRQLSLLDKEQDLPQLDLWKGSRSRRARSAYVAEMMATARRLILAEGRPLTRSELLQRLEAEGYVIDGSDKSKVLGTNLWRSEQFQHIGKKGYWPQDTPVPRTFAKSS